MLQKAALQAQEEMARGKRKLRFFRWLLLFNCNLLVILLNYFSESCFSLENICRQAGKQIQGVVTSAYKIERQAQGMLLLCVIYSFSGYLHVFCIVVACLLCNQLFLFQVWKMFFENFLAGKHLNSVPK